MADEEEQAWWKPYYRQFGVDALSFTVPRKVKIVDARLAAGYYVGVILVVLFTVYNVMVNQNWVEINIPTHSVAVYSGSTYAGPRDTYNGTSFLDAQDDFFNNFHSSPLCNNSTYDHADTKNPEYNYVNNGCRFPLDAEVSVKSGRDFFVTTFSARKQESYIKPVVSDGNWTNVSCSLEEFANLGHECPEGSNPKKIADSCYCFAPFRGEFFVGIENLTLVIEHAYDSDYKAGSKPKTHVRLHDSDDDAEVFDEGEKLELPVWRWLEIAGIPSLDERNKKAGKDSNGAYPTYRLTGLLLNFEFKYYNYKNNPQPNKYDSKPVCVLKIKPETVWTSLGNQIDSLQAVNLPSQRTGTVITQYSYGVKFAFSASGEVNKFSVVMLITALSTAFVLLGQWSLVMSLVAYHLSGRMAKTYKEAANTTFNWRREYARYAANSLVAKQSFDTMDQDGSGSIGRQEIYTALSDVFRTESFVNHLVEGGTAQEDILNSEDIKVLTEFIMQETDANMVDKKSKLGDGRINLAEWIAIITDDTTNYDTLSNLINSMPEYRRTRFLERFTTFTQGFKTSSFQERRI